MVTFFMSKIRWFLFDLGVYNYPELITDLIGKFCSRSEEVLFLCPSNGILNIPDQITRCRTEFKEKHSDITVHVIPYIEAEENSAEKNIFQDGFKDKPADPKIALERVQRSNSSISKGWSGIYEGQGIECCCDTLCFFYQSSNIRLLLPNTVAHSDPKWKVCGDKVWEWLAEMPNCMNKDGLIFSACPPEECVVPWGNLYEKLHEKGYGLWAIAQSCSQGSNNPVRSVYTNNKSEESLWAINTTDDLSCITGCYTMDKNGKGHWIVDAFIIDERMQWSRYSRVSSEHQASKESNFPRFLGLNSQLGAICAQEMESILQRILYPLPERDPDGNPGVDHKYFSYFDSPIVSMVERDSVFFLLEHMLLRYVLPMGGSITVRTLNNALATDLNECSQKFDQKYLIVLTDDSALQAGIFQSPLDTCMAMVKQKKIMTRFVIVRSSLEDPRQIDGQLCGTMELSIAFNDLAVFRLIGSHIESCTYENPLKRDDNDDVNIHHNSGREQEDTPEMTVQYLISNAQKHYAEEADLEKFLNQEGRNGR